MGTRLGHKKSLSLQPRKCLGDGKLKTWPAVPGISTKPTAPILEADFTDHVVNAECLRLASGTHEHQQSSRQFFRLEAKTTSG